MCNSAYDQLVYIAIENTPQLARNTPNCLNCCSSVVFSIIITYFITNHALSAPHLYKLVLWRCHIAPAKPNGPIPLDLNDKRWNLTVQIVFYICHRAHTDLSCPAWYRTLRPHTVLACFSHRVLTVSSPCTYRLLGKMWYAALKYLWML